MVHPKRGSLVRIEFDRAEVHLRDGRVGFIPHGKRFRKDGLPGTHPNRSVAALARAALALGAGGVGRYDRSGFIHIDSGAPRDWSA